MWRRLRVALATPLFLASTVAIFMFIGSNEEVLYIYCQRLDSKGLCDWQTGFCRKSGKGETDGRESWWRGRGQMETGEKRV